MKFVIAAALAVVAALAEFTVVPYMRIGDAVLHPALVLGVVWAVAGGLEVGLAWAFMGGLALDILGLRPLGSSAFSLLLAIALASMVGGALSRARIIAPILATLAASAAFSFLLLIVTTVLTGAPLSDTAIGGLVPSALYDAALATLTGPLVVAIVMRREARERVDW